MRQPTATPYPISDFLNWQVSKQLVIAPKFQRRPVWPAKAKSFLIDTILRGMPVPPLFVRLKVDPVQRRTVREVVDGQQRIRTILEFVGNEFPVLKVHNRELGGYYYSDLPEDVQSTFLGYSFLVNVLQDVSDSEVLDIFARINTYAVQLNSQELRNANFTGAFKQAMYSIAHQHNSFWSNNAVFSDRDIARMKEVEFVSELVMTMLDGIRSTKGKEIDSFYREFDDEFPQENRVRRETEGVLEIIGEMFPGTLKRLPYRSKPMFFSLFIALYDARFGLPDSDQDRLHFTTTLIRRIGDQLAKFAATFTSDDPPAEVASFLDASRRATADEGRRRTRHQFLWANLFLAAGRAE